MEKNDIIIIHGRDYKNMAKKVLEQADVAGDIGSRDKTVSYTHLDVYKRQGRRRWRNKRRQSAYPHRKASCRMSP